MEYLNCVNKCLVILCLLSKGLVSGQVIYKDVKYDKGKDDNIGLLLCGKACISPQFYLSGGLPVGWDGMDYGRRDPWCASAIGSVLLSGCGCATNCVLKFIAMSCLI